LEEGLFEIGEVTDDLGFVRWPETTDDAIRRIRHLYVAGYADAKCGRGVAGST